MNNNPDSIVIVCAGDDNYSLPLAVTLYSALSNLAQGTKSEVYVLDGGISTANKQRIETMLGISIIWVRPDKEQFGGLKAAQHHLSDATFLRLSVGTALPTNVSRIIFLDSDIVVEADLQELWALDAGEETLMAVRDYGIPYLSSPGGPPELEDIQEIKRDKPYFNAGVLVINLDAWRQRGVAQKCYSYLMAHQDTAIHADQEGLNVVLDSWKCLPLEWNVQVGAIQHYHRWPESQFKTDMSQKMRKLLRHPKVVHFTGHRKPWQTGLTNPARHRFIHYLKESHWFSPAEYIQWNSTWTKNNIASASRSLMRSIFSRSKTASS